MASILDESEKKGNGGLKSLMSLIKGEMITLHFSNEGFYGSNVVRKFTLKVYTNSTVFELHDQVGTVLFYTNISFILFTVNNLKPPGTKLNSSSIRVT